MLRISMYSLAVLCLLGFLAGSRLLAAEREASKPESVTYTGIITSIQNHSNPGAMVVFTMNVDGNLVRVETAPAKILTKFGLTFTEKQSVTVSGLLRMANPAPAPDAPIISHLLACTVTVEGKDYQLRNDKGAPTWTYFDIAYELRDVSGEITKVQVNAAQTGSGLLFITVKAADNTYNVFVARQEYAQKIQFAPEVGMKITMTGWVNVMRAPGSSATDAMCPYNARTITVDGKTYEFRDANGRALWEPARPAAAGAPAAQK